MPRLKSEPIALSSNPMTTKDLDYPESMEMFLHNCAFEDIKEFARTLGFGSYPHFNTLNITAEFTTEKKIEGHYQVNLETKIQQTHFETL